MNRLKRFGRLWSIKTGIDFQELFTILWFCGTVISFVIATILHSEAWLITALCIFCSPVLILVGIVLILGFIFLGQAFIKGVEAWKESKVED